MTGQNPYKRVGALFCATLVVLSTMATAPVGAAVLSGGVANTSNVGNAPSVSITDTVMENGSDSYVEVAYNASDQGVSTNNIEVWLYNDSTDRPVGLNSTVPSDSGIANVTIPAGVMAHNGTVRAELVDNTSGSSNTIATDTAWFTVFDGGGGGGGDGGGGAPSVTQVADVFVTDIHVNETTVNESENFELNVTLSNVGDTEETVSVTPMAFEWDNGLDGNSESWSTQKTVPAHDSVNATLVVNISSYGGYDVSAGSFPNGARVTVLADGTNVVLRNVNANQEVVANESQLFFVDAKNYGNVAGYGNLSMERKDGTVLTWSNTTTIDPGNSTSAAFAHTFTTKGEQEVYFNHSGGRELMNVTVREDPVVASSFQVVEGPTPTESLSLDAGLNANQISVRMQNASGGNELDGTGVTAATKFRINVTLKNFTSRVLIGSARNASWERTAINDTHTRLTIVGTPAEVQYTFSDYTFQNWPDEDQADYSRNLTVDFSAFSLDSFAGGDGWAERVNGTLISTDAQMFGTPDYNETANGGTGALELTVAAPHYNTDGTVNDGFYEAQIPQSLLDEWGVTDASALGANYKGSSATIDAELLPGGGAKVAVPLTYSSGTVSIAPTGGGGGGENSPASTSSRTYGSSGNSGGSSAPPANSVTVSEATVSADGSQSASASVTNAKANSTVSVSFDGDESGDGSAADGASNASADAALERLNVSLADDAEFDVDVRTSSEVPEAAESTPGPDDADVVSYVEVDHEGLSDEQVSAASLTLRVSKDRFGDGFDPASAAVYRLHDGEWTELDTTLVGETDGHYRFRAESPGLSVFAVGQKSPSLSVESTSLSSGTADVGDTVTVDVTVANDGGAAGEYTASLAVDGEDVDAGTVTVPAGETVTVTLEWTAAEAGDYALGVNGEVLGTVSVASAETPTPTTETTIPPTTETTTPGFGALAGLLALLCAALLARRRA